MIAPNVTNFKAADGRAAVAPCALRALLTGSAAQRVEPAAVALGRPRCEVGAERLCEPPLLALPLACRNRVGVFLVELGRRARRPAPLGEPGHGDGEPLLSAPDLEPVADLHVARRLDALAVDVHVPAD